MIYVFDIDNTICKTIGSDYQNSQPIVERIQKINLLFDNGNIINFHTARGMNTYKSDIQKVYNVYYDFTFKQLNSWGVKFHQLIMGKPPADFYIDDKGIKDEDYF
jgi:capsule biosynthesis phosphatase